MVNVVAQKTALVIDSSATPFAGGAPLDATPAAGALVITVFSGNKAVPSIDPPAGFTERAQYLGASVAGALADGTGNPGNWTWGGTAGTHNFGALGTFETDAGAGTWAFVEAQQFPNPGTDTNVSSISGDLGGTAVAAGVVFALVGVDSAYEQIASPWTTGSTVAWTNGFVEVARVVQDTNTGATASGPNASGVAFILAKKNVAIGDTLTTTVSWSGGTPASIADQAFLILSQYSVTAGSTVTGTAVAALGGLTATALGASTVKVGTAVAALGGLTATAAGAVTTPAVRTLVSTWLGLDAITARTTSTGSGETVRVAFSTSSGMTSPVYSASASPDSFGTTKHALPALTADTPYWYQVERGGQLLGTAQAFRSLPGTGVQSYTFAFSSCRNHTGDAPILADAITRGIDFFLEIGDFHYRDITTNDQSLFRAGYEELHTRTNINALLKSVPTDHIPDDHDIGGNNADSTTASIPAAQVVYRERVPSPTLPHANGLYHTFTVGRVRYIVLDCRSFRSPVGNTDNSSKTMLGSAQKTWLQGLLDTATEPLTVIVSSVGWCSSAVTKTDDEWGFYTTEQAQVGGWITAAESRTTCVFLCGDMHRLAYDDGTNTVAGVAVYQAAPLLQSDNALKGGPYSGGTFYSNGQYGYMEVVDDGSSVALTYSGIKSDGTVWATHTTTSAVFTLGTAAAALGGLTATAAGVRATTGTATATLGGLTATATGVRATRGTAVAVLGGLTAHAVASSVSYLGATGPELNPSVWLVDRTTAALSPLPRWASLTLSPVENSPGSCELTVPAGAQGFDELYDGVSATPQRDQEIEVWLAGNEDTRMHWLLQQKSGDDLQPGQLWTFTGGGLELLLAEVLVGPQATETQELIFGGATYGTILITALQQAQLRAGVLDGVTWDFSTTLDSNGVAWANTITDLKFAPDATLLDVADVGPEEGIGEFEITADRVLRAFNFGTRGVDRSTGGTPLRLAHGANLSEAARRESSRAGDAATAALGKGADGVYEWATDATAESERGRRVEVAVDAGQITSSGGVLAAAQGRLETMKTGVSERTHGLEFGPGLPIPRVDFDVADWGLSVTGNAATRQRITQWTATFAPGMRARGTVRTNDLVAERLVKLIKQLNRVQRGGTVVGTSTAGPEVDDGKLPAAPTGLAASSSAYLDADGVTWASVQAAWTDVTTNADATAADDIVGYLTQFRYTAGAPLPTGWQALPQVQDNAIDFDGVNADQPCDVRVAAIDKFDHISAWSSIYSFTSGADATPPPVPSTPIVESYLGILTVAWDGLGSAGEARPPDFSHVEVHVSTASGFTPHRPLLADGSLDEDASTTYVDRLSGAGTMPSTIGDYGQTWYSKLVAVDRSRNASAASAQDSAVLAQAGDGDVSALSIGKLTAGIMSALMTVSGIIRTAASGSRVELDTTGFRCYFGSTQVLNFTIATGALSLIGKLTSGLGIGTGRTIVVDPATLEIALYPNATAQRIRLRSLNDGNPNTGASVPMFWLETLAASGANAGPMVATWDDGIWVTFKSGSSYRGGLLKLYDTSFSNGAYFGFQSSTVDAFHQVNSSGEHRFRGAFASEISATGGLRIGNSDVSSAFLGVNISYGATVVHSMNLQVTVVDGAGVNPGYVSIANATGFTANYETARNVSVCWQAWGT